MMDVLLGSFIAIPLFYFFLVFTSKLEDNRIALFNLWGGLIILFVFMFLFPFVDSNDKPVYQGMYLDAENYYENDNRELFWGKIQIFLSKVMFKNIILYWYFYSIIYCLSYYIIAKKFFPYQYAGYFVLCVVACMGFVNYGSNTIRAGFGIALLLMSFCTNRRSIKVALSVLAIGCHLTMLLPVVGYLVTGYIVKKERWCEIIWILLFCFSALTSSLSDILGLIGAIDNRADAFESDEVYNTGFRVDFIIYSLIPIIISRYNIKNMPIKSDLYNRVYRTYVINNAFWLLLIRMPYTDRVAYLSWFMIPFLLLYPVLNGLLNNQHPQRYIFRVIGLFLLVNVVLTLKSQL